MAADEKKAGEGFTVTDRRRVRIDEDDAVQVTPDTRATTTPDPGETRDTGETGPDETSEPSTDLPGPDALENELPPLDFNTFVLSLASSAMVHLGEVSHPETGEPSLNIPLARQTIDMLAMLQEKTQGNLAKDESTYLQAILSDLRLRCVAICDTKKKP